SSSSQTESSSSQTESSSSQTESSSSQTENSTSQTESSTSQTESSSAPASSSDPASTVVSETDFTTAFHVEMGGTMITSYNGSAEVVEFPTMIDGKKIQMISNKGSVDNYNPTCAYPSIKVAIIPNSVSDIDGYAFYNCKNLTSVTFGENIYWVSKEAFSGCTNLTDVAINDSIYHIDSDAFKGCTKLNNVTYKGNTYSYANIDALIKAING
ncbi:MAG: leucine-rich repeat domain-containing protein, partial [Oscillospiraceae bacterium]